MLQVEEFRSLDSPSGLRQAWDGLSAQTPRASFFQTWDWLNGYWRHHGENQRLRTLLVLEGGQPLSIVPLTVRTEPTRAGRVRTLTYPLDDWGSFFGPIGPRPEALAAALRHIRATPRDWDLLDLRWVNPDLDGLATPQCMVSAGFQAYPQVVAGAGLVQLQGTWDDYFATRTSHWRNNVRRAERRVGEAGEIDHVHFRPAGFAEADATLTKADARWDLYDECESIAAASWQGTSATGTTLSHAAVRAFLRDMHGVAAARGAVDLHLLRVGGRPAAFAYNYCYRGHVFGLRMGYDAGVLREGLGTVLLRRVIEGCFRRGDHTLDLGINYLDAKRNWLTAVVPVYRYTHFPLGVPRVQLLRVKRMAQQWLGRRAAQPTN